MPVKHSNQNPTIAARQLLKRLGARGVSLWFDGGVVEIISGGGTLDDATIELLHRLKWELAALLDPQAPPPIAAASNACHQHIDPAEWEDEPASHGAIRTHCRSCGAFIGYRRIARTAARLPTYRSHNDD